MPGGAQYFSLLDLKGCMFFVPLHPDSQTFLPLNGGNLIPWKHLDSASWGFLESPHVLGNVLAKELMELSL